MHVYTAMCYFKLDFYDVALDALWTYLQDFPFSVWACNIYDYTTLYKSWMHYRTILISIPLYLTFAILQWQWHNNLDFQNLLTYNTSHHFCNLSLTPLIGPLQCPLLMLSLGLLQLPNLTITCLFSIHFHFIVILLRIFSKYIPIFF